MEEAYRTNEKEVEKRKKPEAKHTFPEQIKKGAEIKTKQAPKKEPSVIRISVAPMRIDVATGKNTNRTPRQEAIRVKQEVFGLEGKPIEKREIISLSEMAPPTMVVTPSRTNLKKEAFQLRIEKPPEVRVVPKPELKAKPPLKLEGEVTPPLPREKVSLEPKKITLPKSGAYELIRKRAHERVVEEGEIKALEETPNFYDIFLMGGFGGLTALDRAVCIILPKPSNESYESYVNSVALICRELYRIKKGGKPSPRFLSHGSKEEIEKCLRAEESIFVIDDFKCELLNFNNIKKPEEIDWEHLYDRLRDLFSQEYGFVIFHLNGDWVDAFRSRLENVAHMIPKLLAVKLINLSPYVKAKIARMCWGCVTSRGETFDEVFCNAEKAFYDRLEEISKDDWLMHCTKPHAAGSESPESPEHRLLKALVVKIIAKEKGIKRELIPNKIFTEYEITEGLTADVYVHDGKEAIEVETLYGTGFNPVDKIDHETLQKYVQRHATFKISEVKVVLLPLPFLTYLKSLTGLRKIYKTEHGISVKFYTVDVENEKLIPLEEIIKRLRELKKQIEEARYPVLEG